MRALRHVTWTSLVMLIRLAPMFLAKMDGLLGQFSNFYRYKIVGGPLSPMLHKLASLGRYLAHVKM